MVNVNMCCYFDIIVSNLKRHGNEYNGVRLASSRL